jgi:hypothetical protein
MGAVVQSIATTIGSRFEAAGTGHVEPDLLAQIPPEMLAQFRREGVRRAWTTPFMALGFYTAISAIWSWTAPDLEFFSLSRVLIFLLVQLGVSILFFRMIARGALNGELRFREVHGKWRWEK